jgi:hypothetical protein
MAFPEGEMVRFSFLLAGFCAAALPALAQKPGAYDFLPVDARPEYRDVILGSTWMRRLNSAAGWIVIQRIHRESEELDEREGPGNGATCAGSLRFYSDEDAGKVTRRDDSERLEHILPGNRKEIAQRASAWYCQQKSEPQPLQRFETARARPDELQPDFAEGFVRSYLSAATFNAKDLVSADFAPVGWGRMKRFEIRESDPQLKVGASIALNTTLRIQLGGDGRVDAYYADELSSVVCTIAAWETLGERNDALPFKAARLDCSRAIKSQVFDPVTNTPAPMMSSALGKWNHLVIPELGLDVTPPAGGSGRWIVTCDAPGRWRLSMLSQIDRNTPRERMLEEILIISPEAASRYLPVSR